jgi:ABC transporter substrate binding protein (PQQ-dependent alcohol dehydrogenase system)
MRQLAPYALIYLLAIACAAGVATQSQAADAPLQVQIGYLGYRPDTGPLLSNVIPEPVDAGLRGAELAVTDSNSTGRFLNHSYSLVSASADSPDALVEAAKAQHEQGLRLFVVNAPVETLRRLSAVLPDSLLFNAGSPDDSLRTTDCLPNVLHSLPSRAMLADALAQFLVVRKWQRALLIVGPTPDDQAYAAALRRAAKRFGLKLVAEKAWSFDNDRGAGGG